ncbi:MAG: HAMP domain-containing histidine kinase, partial [Hyphomicrobiales bacterium]|nr:HAMP domain-containing histidine kinase [Hyphomicrobiales bacterium]
LRYLLTDSAQHRLAGSLPITAAVQGWQNVRIANPDPADREGAPRLSLMAYGVTLPGGARLVVASDNSDLDELRRRLSTSALVFGVAISLLALIGGALVGSLFVRRLDGVNKSVERIMQGALTERLPAIGIGPEFDQLTRQLNRMLDKIEGLMAGMRQVSTDIAHDLRTPLTRLRQKIEAMKLASSAPSEAQLENILAETDSILAIFGALLRISALEAGNGRQRFARMDLSEVAERVFHAYEPVADDSGHHLAARIAPGVTIVGDAELIAQALTNLIENSLFHTPPGSTITLSLRTDGAAAHLSVADNGQGIPGHEFHKVLGRFYRLDSSRHSRGAGLGLSLVAAIAELHEARLTLSDNGPGLRVEMRLPLATGATGHRALGHDAMGHDATRFTAGPSRP